MVNGYLLLAILIVIVYSIVWTGDCRLGCQANNEDAISGLSCLEGPTGSRAPTCVCESCPCDLLDDFLKKCTPATQLYSASAGVVCQYYNGIANWISELFDRALRVLECRTSCRRQAQIVHSRSNFDSNEDFSIVEKDDEKPKITPISSISQVAQKYGGELAQRISDISSKLSTSTQPVPILPKSSRQCEPPAPSQAKPAVPTQIMPSTSFKTRPPVPSPLKLPDPPPEDKPVAAAQDKVPSSLKIKSSPPMTPTYDNSTVTKQSSMCSLAKPTPPPTTSSKTSVPPEKPTSSSESKKASKAKDPKKQKPGDISGSSSVEDKINCSKCVEQGKTCIGGCPSAEERRQK